MQVDRYYIRNCIWSYIQIVFGKVTLVLPKTPLYFAMALLEIVYVGTCELLLALGYIHVVWNLVVTTLGKYVPGSWKAYN